MNVTCCKEKKLCLDCVEGLGKKFPLCPFCRQNLEWVENTETSLPAVEKKFMAHLASKRFEKRKNYIFFSDNCQIPLMFEAIFKNKIFMFAKAFHYNSSIPEISIPEKLEKSHFLAFNLDNFEDCFFLENYYIENLNEKSFIYFDKQLEEKIFKCLKNNVGQMVSFASLELELFHFDITRTLKEANNMEDSGDEGEDSGENAKVNYGESTRTCEYEIGEFVPETSCHLEFTKDIYFFRYTPFDKHDLLGYRNCNYYLPDDGLINNKVIWKNKLYDFMKNISGGGNFRSANGYFRLNVFSDKDTFNKRFIEEIRLMNYKYYNFLRKKSCDVIWLASKFYLQKREYSHDDGSPASSAPSMAGNTGFSA